VNNTLIHLSYENEENNPYRNILLRTLIDKLFETIINVNVSTMLISKIISYLRKVVRMRPGLVTESLGHMSFWHDFTVCQPIKKYNVRPRRKATWLLSIWR
jgi:hypothetical protein